MAQYGSPLFVFSERTLVERYRDLEQAFARRYASVRLAWSYKTNYLQAICRMFHREGAFAEVVSPFEYDKAVALGLPPERIHFNGPYKPDDALARAVAGGSILHVDNLDEIARIERVAQRAGARAVAIRVNMAIEGVQSWSRFGLNLESGQAHEAVARVLGGEGMDLIGLHTHIGTFMHDPQAYGTAASKMARLANELRARARHAPVVHRSRRRLRVAEHAQEQYLDGEQASPPFSRYAEAICDGLARARLPGGADADAGARDRPRPRRRGGQSDLDGASHEAAPATAAARWCSMPASTCCSPRSGTGTRCPRCRRCAAWRSRPFSTARCA